MDVLGGTSGADASFCRLCLSKEGAFRKIESIADEVISNRIIPYLMEKHLHIKILEVSYAICEDCCCILFSFEDFYAKVRLHIEKFYGVTEQIEHNIKSEATEGIVFNNPFDSFTAFPKSLEKVEENAEETLMVIKEETRVKTPPQESVAEPQAPQKRVTRSAALKRNATKTDVLKPQSKEKREKPKGTKRRKPAQEKTPKVKEEPEFSIQEIPEINASVEETKQRFPDSLAEFDFREDDSDSDAASDLSDWDEWPGGVNLDDFPKQIIENGLLKVKGRDLMMLICKFYSLECYLCDKDKVRFKDLRDLFHHHTKVHNEKGHVMCCSTKFNRYPAIIMHMVRHIQPDAFRCDICGYMVTRPRFLEIHKKTHLPEEEKPYACDKCPRRFCWKNAFQVHKLSHQPRDVRKHFICHICGKVYDTPGGLCTHRKLAHTDYKSEAHVCHVCAKKFATRTGLNEHMATIHQPREKDQVQCQKCGKWLMNNRCLKSHMILHSSNVFSCKVCDYTTKKESLLRRHQLTRHSDAKPFVCSICNRAFKLKRALTVHVAQHENSKQYKCTFCERIFNSSTNFYTHRKTVHPEELNALKKAKLDEQRRKRIEAGVEAPSQMPENPRLNLGESSDINSANYANINQQVQAYQFIDQHGGVTTIIAEGI
ncbi:zinc finger protein 155-like [Phlebotomus argentipes]|uniref:zinc finger protein 155-like n=1 Tax=Phlebotomus argentipes TaxID=94469 RepID=UPI002892C569|nr:zinc finger protein 155-like [Phlebotomus argentipes]